MTPNQAVSVAAQRKINEKRGQTPPQRRIDAIIAKKTRALLKDGRPEAGLQGEFYSAPSDATLAIPTGSVKLVVTSPPFLDIVQYAADNWLRCWFAGIDAATIEISMHRRPEDWTAFVHRTFAELGRIVAPGGHVAFEVGEVRNGTIELEKLVLDALSGTPFTTRNSPRPPIAGAWTTTPREQTPTGSCWRSVYRAKAGGFSLGTIRDRKEARLIEADLPSTPVL